TRQAVVRGDPGGRGRDRGSDANRVDGAPGAGRARDTGLLDRLSCCHHLDAPARIGCDHGAAAPGTKQGEMKEALARKLEALPDGPGVYLWKDAAGEVVYVGKARNLRSRVRSYFSPEVRTPQHDRLVAQIADVETIVVPDEAQSLLLENNLIKEFQPRFNIRLKDDKSYPSIAVTLGDPFPRVIATRRRDIAGARYF